MQHFIRMFTCLVVMVGLVASAHATDFEQTIDQNVHTVYGTATGGPWVKGGLNFDGGNSGLLLGWPGELFGGSITNAVLHMRSSANDDQGAFTVHQMITQWDEASNWGTSLPVAGTDYNPHPVGLIGHNPASSPDKADETEISHLVSYWAGGGTNNGLFIKPIGVANNPNYPGGAPTGGQAEFMFASRHRVLGAIDSDDQFIRTDIGGHSFLPNFIEPISNVVINQAAPSATLDKKTGAGGASAGVEGGNLKIPLLKWGLGEITAAAPTLATRTTVGTATMQVGSWSSNAVDFNVHQMLSAWDEISVTWNQFGASGPQSGTDYDTTSLGTITVGNGGQSTSLAITDTFNFWLANPSLNHGVILVPVNQSGTDDTSVIFSNRVIGLDGGTPGDDTWIGVSDVYVPEPSTLALGALGVLCLVQRRRKA